MSEFPPRSPPTAEQLARYAEAFNESPAFRVLGMRLSFVDTRVRLEIPSLKPEHRGGLGTAAVNGGILAAVFDYSIGCTAALIDPTRRSATIQLSMSFERPVVGDRLICEAHIDSAGTKTIFSSARIIDSHGNTCARCQGVLRLGTLPWRGASESPSIN